MKKKMINLLIALTIGFALSSFALGQGMEQTPIDLRTEILTFVESLPSVRFAYNRDAALTVLNTGSPDHHATIKATPPAGSSIRVSGVTYNLLQFHWHTHSEHLVNGRSTPLEMHFVHQAADGTLLVIGVFIKQGDRHDELNKIFGNLPQMPGQTVSVNHFNLRKVFPDDRESYRYRGSLTTPPFSEGVRWIVLAEPIEMSRRQIDNFKALFPHDNTREVQPLFGRTVLTDIER